MNRRSFIGQLVASGALMIPTPVRRLFVWNWGQFLAWKLSRTRIRNLHVKAYCGPVTDPDFARRLKLMQEATERRTGVKFRT